LTVANIEVREDELYCTNLM